MHGTAWSTPDAPLLPSLPPGVHRTGVVVVGLGGSGLSALLRLVEHGRADAIGIDAHGVASGAAGRNGGFLLAGAAPFHHQARAAWGAEPAGTLYRLTEQAIVRLALRHPRVVRPVGSLRLAADNDEISDLDAHEAALKEDGFPVERLDRRRLYIPGDAVMDPARRVVELAHRALDAGVRLHVARACQLSPGRVETDRSEIHADHVLVCVDGALPALLPRDLHPAGLRTVRLQMAATAPEPRPLAEHAVYHRYGLDYWQQRPDGRLFVGGCRDLGEPAEHGAPPDPPPTALPTDAVQQGIDHLLREVIGTRAPVTSRWAGLVAYTDDQLPVVIERAGISWIGGYAGTGNVVGCLLGEALADQLARPSDATPDILAALEAAREALAAAERPTAG